MYQHCYKEIHNSSKKKKNSRARPKPFITADLLKPRAMEKHVHRRKSKHLRCSQNLDMKLPEGEVCK